MHENDKPFLPQRFDTDTSKAAKIKSTPILNIVKRTLNKERSTSMSRFSHTDIVIELSELCKDLVGEIRQQLNYYRASVYKDETSRHITYRVEKLRMITNLMRAEPLLEAFRDHDAEKASGHYAYVPGECSFSARTTRLLSTIEEACSDLIYQASCRNVHGVPKSLTRNVQKHRQELLKICRQGTRQWAFFQSLY